MGVFCCCFFWIGLGLRAGKFDFLVFFKMDTLHPKLHRTGFDLVWGFFGGGGYLRK